MGLSTPCSGKVNSLKFDHEFFHRLAYFSVDQQPYPNPAIQTSQGKTGLLDSKPNPEVLKIITGLKPSESVLLPPVKTAGASNKEIYCFDPRFDLNKVEPLPEGVKGRDRSITVCSRTQIMCLEIDWVQVKIE